MKNATIARRYARALYALATETKSIDDVMTGLGNVRLALELTKELRQIFFNPTIKPEAKQKLIASVTSNKMVVRFIAVLARRKRLDLIPTIHDQISEMNDTAHGIVRPLVRTAVPLTEDQKRDVEKQLAKTIGGKVEGRFDVAKELIGGIWVKLGDKVLEASLKGRLNNFRQTILHSVN